VTEETLFLAALEQRDLEQRQAFLRQACADDVALYRRVEQLLVAYDAGQDKLNPDTGLAHRLLLLLLTVLRQSRNHDRETAS
jgi:hypothetical protein